MGPEDKARVVSVSEPDSRRFGVRSAPVRWSASLIERASLVPASMRRYHQPMWRMA